MRIGELARAAAVPIQTLRFYERRKLLPPPERTASGYRAYSNADLQRVRLIVRSKRLGFSLKEIGRLLALHSAGERFDPQRAVRSPQWKQAFRIAEKRLALIDEELRTLEEIRARLVAVFRPESASAQTSCPASAMTGPDPRIGSSATLRASLLRPSHGAKKIAR